MRDTNKETDKEKEIGMVFLLGCRCRCGHVWLPRDKEEKPRVCPKCKSANWDRQYVIRNNKPKRSVENGRKRIA